MWLDATLVRTAPGNGVSRSTASPVRTTASDLVVPRMRAVAGAYYILMNTFIGLALGPYVMGKLSDVFIAGGMSGAESLRTAIELSMLTLLPAMYFMVLAYRHLPKDEARRLDVARALGEPLPETP